MEEVCVAAVTVPGVCRVTSIKGVVSFRSPCEFCRLVRVSCSPLLLSSWPKGVSVVEGGGERLGHFHLQGKQASPHRQTLGDFFFTFDNTLFKCCNRLIYHCHSYLTSFQDHCVHHSNRSAEAWDTVKARFFITFTTQTRHKHKQHTNVMVKALGGSLDV